MVNFKSGLAFLAAKFKTFFALLKTNVRSTTRNKMALFVIILFPLIFVGVFGLAFQDSDPETSTKLIGILNYDSGIESGVIAFWNESQVSDNFYSEEYIEIINTTTYLDTDEIIFDLTEYNLLDKDQAIQDLEKRSIYALVTIPENFSLGVLAVFRNLFGENPALTVATNNWAGYPEANFTTTISVEGDRSLQDFNIAANIIEIITNSFFNLGDSNIGNGEVEIKGTLDSSGFTSFDFIFPGIMVFGILQALGAFIATALNDIEMGTFQRIRLSKVRPANYLLSLVTYQMFNTFIQIPLMFLTALIFGFPFSIQILYAFIFGVFLSLAITGLGLIFAAFVKNAMVGQGLAGMASTPMAILSGAFFVIPNPTIIPVCKFLGGNSFGLLDILPSTPAIRGLRSVLLYNNPLSESLYDLAILAIFAIIYLIIGILLYSRKHFRAQ